MSPIGSSMKAPTSRTVIGRTGKEGNRATRKVAKQRGKNHATSRIGNKGSHLTPHKCLTRARTLNPASRSIAEKRERHRNLCHCKRKSSRAGMGRMEDAGKDLEECRAATRL